MANNYVPLPALDYEQHGIEFAELAFPTGFDEERLLVNVDAVRRTTRMAGLGVVAVHGASGPKSDLTPGISGINSQGIASMGANLTQRKEQLVNGVAVIPRRVQETWQPSSAPMLLEDFRYAPTIVIANVSERDERLRTDSKLKRGLMDPQGHAQFLNTVVSNGLREASKQRYNQRPSATFNKAMVYGLGGLYTAIAFADPVVALESAARIMAIWGVADIGINGLLAKVSGNSFKDAQISVTMGQDRRLASFVLAKTQKFVKVEK